MTEHDLTRTIQALGVLLPMGYLVSTLLFGMAFAGERQPAIERPRGLVFVLTLALHATLFSVEGLATSAFPIVGTWRMVSATAFVTALLFGVLTLRTRQPTAGAIVMALVTGLVTCSSAFGPLDITPLQPAGPRTSPLLVLHATTSVLAASALILSGVYGTLYIVLYRKMQAHSFGPLFQQLPDLELLTRTTRKAAFAGFLCMTLGLNLGIWAAHKDNVAGFEYTDPGVLLTMGIWIHFGLIAFSRWIPGITARRAAVAAALGLSALSLTVLVALAPGMTFHSRG